MDHRDPNPTIEYLNALASLGGDDLGSQARKAMAAMGLPRSCTVLSKFPAEAQSLLKDAMDQNNPEPKLCHDNSWKLCAYSSGNIKIVSGFATSMIPMEHSWIRLELDGESFDFDPTDHAVFGGGRFSSHVEIFSIDRDEALSLAESTGHSGHWLYEKTLSHLGVEMPKTNKRARMRR